MRLNSGVSSARISVECAVNQSCFTIIDMRAFYSSSRWCEARPNDGKKRIWRQDLMASRVGRIFGLSSCHSVSEVQDVNLDRESTMSSPGASRFFEGEEEDRSSGRDINMLICNFLNPLVPSVAASSA